MKETHIKTRVVRTALVVAVAAMLVFSFATTAFAVLANGGSPAIELNGTTGYGSAYSGYVLWSTATASTFDPANQGAKPHGNYTVNTLKCAVCHSVHGAASGGVALTQVRSNLHDPSEICAYCHGIGNSITDKIVSVGYLTGSDHGGGCAGACHGRSVHGANRSKYMALAVRLLHNTSDVAIDNAIANSSVTGITSAIMNNVADDGLPPAMATAYVCGAQGNGGGCHGNSAFGVMTNKYAQDVSGTNAGTWKKGHPVFQNARTNWSEAGAQYGNKTDYPSGVTIAWADTDGCRTCHDAIDSVRGKPAFPHNQVSGPATNVSGNPVLPHVGTTSRLWLSKAAFAGDTRKKITDPAYQTNYAGIVDGICIKCHRPSVSAGVGYQY
jgi:hypothetical protein